MLKVLINIIFFFNLVVLKNFPENVTLKKKYLKIFLKK